jgi:RNA polymerase sigma factor for flagellar operon FliA
MDIDTLNSVLADVGHSIVISLEDMLTYGEDTYNFEDGLPADTSLSPLAAAESSIRKQLLAQAIDELPEKEKFVIGLYYGDSLTLKEIAEVLGVTQSRVCQLHSKAAARLHGKLARHADLLLAAA